MSTPQVLLGLLSRGPRHGYELKREHDARLAQARPLPYVPMYADLRCSGTGSGAGRPCTCRRGRRPTERQRRGACLQAVVVLDAARRGGVLLVLEQDDSLPSWDSQLIEPTRGAGCRQTLR